MEKGRTASTPLVAHNVPDKTFGRRQLAGVCRFLIECAKTAETTFPAFLLPK